MSGHTKEPWVVFPRNSEIYIGIGEETGDGICDGGYGLWRDGPERKANAERIVACVNAMAGVDDPVGTMALLRLALTTAKAITDAMAEADNDEVFQKAADLVDAALSHMGDA